MLTTLWWLACMGSGAGADELQNSSFESGDPVPDSWTALGSGKFEHRFGDALDGDWSMVMGDSGHSLLYQRVSGTSGLEYQAAVFARASADTAEATLKLEFHAAPELKISESVLDFSATESWIEYKSRDVAPAGTALVTATIVALQGGEVQFDVVSLEEPLAPLRLTFDVKQRQQEFVGFGSQIWGYDAKPMLLEQAISELGLTWVRIENHDEASTWSQVQATRALTDRFGLDWIYMVWSAPPEYRSGGLLDDPEGFGLWWADHVESAVLHGVPVEWIELMNEPDSNGAWSTGIAPVNYNALVKATRAALDARGLEEVGIVGPGLSAMSWTIPQLYFDALDPSAQNSLAAISTHTWTDDSFNCQNPGADCLQENWFNFSDRPEALAMTQPVFVTEHATKETSFWGESYPSPEGEPFFNATHSMGYALRTMEDVLVLLNAGAESVGYWQAVDEPTEVFDKNKGWGFLDLAGTEKPVYVVARLLSSVLAPGATIVAAPEMEWSPLYAMVAIDQGRITVATSNVTTEPQETTIRLKGVKDAYQVVAATECVIKHDGDPRFEDPDTAVVMEVVQEIERASTSSIDLPIVQSPQSFRVVTLAKRGVSGPFKIR